MNICLRCGYEWEPRKTDGRVRQCPHCHSAKWDSRAVGKPERAVVTVPKLRAALKAARKATEGKEPDQILLVRGVSSSAASQGAARPTCISCESELRRANGRLVCRKIGCVLIDQPQ